MTIDFRTTHVKLWKNGKYSPHCLFVGRIMSSHHCMFWGPLEMFCGCQLDHVGIEDWPRDLERGWCFYVVVVVVFAFVVVGLVFFVVVASLPSAYHLPTKAVWRPLVHTFGPFPSPRAPMPPTNGAHHASTSDFPTTSNPYQLFNLF